MIGVPTTFVIGAGASAPYGRPLGWELHRTAKKLDPHHIAYELLLAQGISANKLNEFLNDLRDHPASSIDAFLTTRQKRTDVMHIGKSMIACLMGLAVAEKAGSKALDGDWLGYVIERMLGASTWQDFSKGNNVKFVTFNFDSLIEQRLTRDLTHVWPEATLDSIPVIHVHGRLPDVPDSSPHRSAIHGPDQRWFKWLGGATATIRVVLEDIDKAILEIARHAIGHARVVCFLGFAYDPDNLDKLDLLNNLASDQLAFGSAFRLAAGEQERVRQLMPQAEIQLGNRDSDCLKVLEMFHVCRDWTDRGSINLSGIVKPR